jgi:hypothetical protein
MVIYEEMVVAGIFQTLDEAHDLVAGDAVELGLREHGSEAHFLSPLHSASNRRPACNSGTTSSLFAT